MAKLMCHDWGEGIPMQKVEGNESKGKGGAMKVRGKAGELRERKGRGKMQE